MSQRSLRRQPAREEHVARIAASPRRTVGPAEAKAMGVAPDYVVICISTYPEELAKLDAMVETLKMLGLRRMNRSALIRIAVQQLDLDKVPRAI